jgi:hypothetical protein
MRRQDAACASVVVSPKWGSEFNNAIRTLLRSILLPLRDYPILVPYRPAWVFLYGFAMSSFRTGPEYTPPAERALLVRQCLYLIVEPLRAVMERPQEVCVWQEAPESYVQLFMMSHQGCG